MHHINTLPAEVLAEIFCFATLPGPKAPQNQRCHPLPLIVSRVCSSWREIVLNTPEAWSVLLFSSSSWDPRPFQVFLERAKRFPLRLIYRSAPSLSESVEFDNTVELVRFLDVHIPRLYSISCRLRCSQSIKHIAETVMACTGTPSLREIDLAFGLHTYVTPQTQALSAPSPEPTAFMKLETLSLFRVRPGYFERVSFSALRKLQLGFPPSRVCDVSLTMQELCRLLSTTPLLESLSLTSHFPVISNTVPGHPPSNDILSSALGEAHLKYIPPVYLPHLVSLDWSFPYACNLSAHRLLLFFDAPNLTSLNIWIEPPRLISHHHTPVTNVDFPEPYRESTAGRTAPTSHGERRYDPIRDRINANMELPSVRELTVQVQTFHPPSSHIKVVDTWKLGHSLRRLTFSRLEKLEVSCVDVEMLAADTHEKTTTSAATEAPSNPHDLPAPFDTPAGAPITQIRALHFDLEHLFRDPRLVHLTHLAISYMNVAPPRPHWSENDGSQRILGYIPNLVSLTLESCVGVGNLLVGLCLDRTRPRPARVVLCPKLESLSFFLCADLTYQSLSDVVTSRGAGEPESATVANPSSDLPDVGALTLQDHSEPKSKPTPPDQSPRIIKPLRRRKARCPQGGGGGLATTSAIISSSSGLGPSGITLSPSSAMALAHIQISKTFPIRYIRISRCPLITQVQARELEAVRGVEDVFWSD